jgi:hypothetical protein
MGKTKKYPRVPEWARAKPESTMTSDLRETKEAQRLRDEDVELGRITSLGDVEEEDEH